MARYCITYETVKLFSTTTGQESIQDLVFEVNFILKDKSSKIYLY